MNKETVAEQLCETYGYEFVFLSHFYLTCLGNSQQGIVEYARLVHGDDVAESIQSFITQMATSESPISHLY